MMDDRDDFVMQSAWDRASATYLTRRGNDVSTVSYGNLSPTDDQLGLLGDLRGLRVLDIGCGGGQNAVACALVGAEVVGLDLSAAQLAVARALAVRHSVSIEWHHMDGMALGGWQRCDFDLVLTLQVLPYMNDPSTMLQVGRALLRPGGRLIMSIDHPIRDCFYDAEMEELSPYPIRSYEDETPVCWRFAAGMPMRMHHYPLGQWIAWLVAAGLQVQEVIEALAPLELCDEVWPNDSPLAPLRAIPHTAILVGNVPN